MSVLAEGISVVVENRVLSARYPGGVMGFERDCPQGSFCSDGRLARAGFISMRDTRVFLGALHAVGLCNRTPAADDYAVVDQNVGLLLPCIWLEFGRDRDGITACWHASARAGRAVVPRGWYPRRLPAYESSPGMPFPRRLRFLKTEDRQDWYQDRRTGELVCLERAYVLH